MTTKNKKSDKKIIIIVASALVFILALVWGGVLLVNGLAKDDAPVEQLPAPEETSSESASSEQIEKTVSGKTVDQDRQDALLAATEILNLANGPADATEFSEQLTKLDNGDTSFINPELEGKIRFADIYNESDELKANVYQALITFSSLIKKATEAEEIKPSSDTLWKNVYVDSELGIAQIPMTIFMGNQASFAMEMVYIDGEWKLAPYTLIEQIKLSASMQPTE